MRATSKHDLQHAEYPNTIFSQMTFHALSQEKCDNDIYPQKKQLIMTQGMQTSLVRSFSQSDFNEFASLSGDNNPIHTDAEFAAQSRFGRPVAHGLLLCGVLRGLIDKVVPGGRLKEQSVNFLAPTYAGEIMRFIVTVKRRSQGPQGALLDFDMEVIRVYDGVITCQGHGKVVV